MYVYICIYIYIYIYTYIYIFLHVRAKFFANNQVELPNAYYNGCLTTCSKCVTLVDIYTWHCVTKTLAVFVNTLRPRLNGYHISDVILLLSLIFLYEKAFWLNFTTKMQFRGPGLFKKKRAIFQEKLHLPGIFMLSWTNWRGDTIVDGWPQFECNFNVFCRYDFATRQPLYRHNSQSRTYQRRYRHVVVMFATCVWLRCLVRLHCDVMITTSATKTWWSFRSLGLTTHANRSKFALKNTMLIR